MISKAENIQMKLTGLSTAADRRTAAAALRAVDGVHRVSVKRDTATVSYDPTRTTVAAVTAALEQDGYYIQ